MTIEILGFVLSPGNPFSIFSGIADGKYSNYY